jgi:hypothetical protein
MAIHKACKESIYLKAKYMSTIYIIYIYIVYYEHELLIIRGSPGQMV